MRAAAAAEVVAAGESVADALALSTPVPLAAGEYVADAPAPSTPVPQAPSESEAGAPAPLSLAPTQGPPADHPTCVICMFPMLPSESNIALSCGHVYHEECVKQYALVKGWVLDRACPLRCGNPAEPEVIDDAPPEQELQDGFAVSEIEALLEQSLDEANLL